MAVEIHKVAVALRNVKPDGTIINKNDPSLRIRDILITELQHRVVPKSSVPNSAAAPTVDDYLVLEAASDFQVVQQTQGSVITQRVVSGTMLQPVTLTVNGSASDPNEIVIGTGTSLVVYKVTAGDIFFTVGAVGTAVAGEGNTRIGVAATRGTVATNEVGTWEVISFSGVNSMYVRSQAVGTATLEFYFVVTPGT